MSLFGSLGEANELLLRVRLLNLKIKYGIKNGTNYSEILYFKHVT